MAYQIKPMQSAVRHLYGAARFSRPYCVLQAFRRVSLAFTRPIVRPPLYHTVRALVVGFVKPVTTTAMRLFAIVAIIRQRTIKIDLLSISHYLILFPFCFIIISKIFGAIQSGKGILVHSLMFQSNPSTNCNG